MVNGLVSDVRPVWTRTHLRHRADSYLTPNALNDVVYSWRGGSSRISEHSEMPDLIHELFPVLRKNVNATSVVSFVVNCWVISDEENHRWYQTAFVCACHKAMSGRRE